ncbi:DUF4214 domain-containing protein [Duganella violaceipulchra]|uniref:DUF4214 domain-containing protein n=1 Tax=Duganella violaceipulchra TaxID=2849652 RepID=A0AA41HJB9_9BURK|nr:DUF4214 domain-containing protein [Duganella violaceicalia]MBV6325221.1 DUF4214 domain-containing protein [Duganella violaceicalia]MCP2012435.1 methionine-rich copper-binding protein CopC [Duganella violaceicalia]
MSDDFSSDINTTGRLVVGKGATGVFETTGDSDWFRMALTAGTSYVLSLDGAPQGAGTLASLSNTTLTVMGPTGQWMYYAYGNGNFGPALNFTPAASGDYYLAASAGYNGIGSYTVKVAPPAADDFAADTSTAGFFFGSTITGVFERPGDADWFKFHAVAGQIIAFSAGAGAVPADTAIYDGSGHYFGSVGSTPFRVATGGDYYLAVSGNSYIGRYTQSMRLLSDDFTVDAPGKLSEGAQRSGSLEFNGDTDPFTITTVAGQIYTVTLNTQASEGRTVYLNLYDGNGQYAGAGSQMANNETVVRFQADKSGTYTVRAESYATLSTALQYTVKLGVAASDDYGNTRADAGLLALGATLHGKVQAPNDVDLFKTELAAGVTYTFSMAADGTIPSYSQALALQDGAGNTVASARYGSDTSFSYTPTKGGSFYLQASGYTGAAYTVTAGLTVDDFGATADSAGRLVVGTPANGELEAGGGDRDWFAVTLDADTLYWFTLKGQKEGAGTLNGGYGVAFNLLDATGKLLMKSDTSYTATTGTLPFTPTVKGTYYLEVAAPQSSGTYQVAAQLGQKDDYGNDAAHAGTLEPGTAASGKLELTSDSDVFKVHLIAGQTYALELAPTDGGGSSWSNYTTLYMKDSADNYVPLRYQYASDGKIHKLFEPAQSADYYLTVGTSTSSGVAGGYKLSATDLGRDDFSATPATLGALSPGVPLTGTIGVEDDHDWIKVHLDAGRTYVFDLHGKLSGGGTLDAGTDYYSAMALVNNYGGAYAYASTSAASGNEPRLTYVAGLSGDYYLDVHGGTGRTGTYTVEETLVSGDVTAPLLASSTVAAGAVDVALAPRFTLNFNETIVLGAGITLTDAAGVAVTGNGEPLASVSGHALVINPHQNLVPGMTYTLNLPDGSVLDLAGNHYAGATSYSFTTVKPVAAGTDGNDYLLGKGTGASLNGGAGLDTVYYTQKQYELSIVRNTDGSVSVTDYWAAKGADTLTGVERLMFSDHAVALDLDGAGGQTYRMYQSAFNRVPDSGGAGFWINLLDHGVSLRTMSQAFIDSPEFRSMYGAAPTDQQFVTSLYNNVLHRAPDAGGNSFWLNTLHDGVSRADVLIGFSESAENQGAIAKIIGAGFSYTPVG